MLRARRIVHSMIDTAEDRTYAALEHFEALCEYLDDLYGGRGFDRLLDTGERSRVAALLIRLRGADAPRVELDDEGRPTGPSQPGRTERLRQLVNSSLTLDEGRELCFDESEEEFDREPALALQGLYRYADDLHGGPGTFTELLETGEREQVAALVESLRPQRADAGRNWPGSGLTVSP